MTPITWSGSKKDTMISTTPANRRAARNPRKYERISYTAPPFQAKDAIIQEYSIAVKSEKVAFCVSSFFFVSGFYRQVKQHISRSASFARYRKVEMV